MKNPGERFIHPYDTPVSSGLRFSVELIAWIAGSWAAAEIGWWAAGSALIVLIGLPAVFSTSGDKRQVLVPTPGPVRIVIELILYAVAAGAPWLIWPVWLAGLTRLVVALALVSGLKRLAWLPRGAP